MKLLTRYVLTQVFLVFFVTLSALTLLLVAVGMVKEAIDQGLGMAVVLRLVPYLVPNALLFAIPGTVLFAVSIVYGRMANANEVVAVKSLGISPMVLVWPTLAFATGLSFLTFWLNDVAVSWGYSGVQQVIVDGVEDIAYGLLRTQRSFSSKQFSVNVKQVDGHKLILPTFTFQSSADSPAVTITAREAELHSKPGSGMLTITCRDGTVDAGGTTFDFPDEWARDINLADLEGAGGALLSPAHLPLRQLPGRIAEQQLAIEQEQQRLAARAAYALLTGEFNELGAASWSGDAQALQNQFNQLNRLLTEPPRRWANGFSCLCFVLVGAPMAMRLKNSDALMSFFACFLPILIVYYPLLVYGVDRAKAGAVPSIAVWLANAVVATWGLWMLRKVVRY